MQFGKACNSRGQLAISGSALLQQSAPEFAVLRRVDLTLTAENELHLSFSVAVDHSLCTASLGAARRICRGFVDHLHAAEPGKRGRGKSRERTESRIIVATNN